MKYRKKPIVIEAFLLGIDEEPEWFIEAKNNHTVKKDIDFNLNVFVNIETLEGVMRADYNKDYIVRGVYGELYPCKKEIFEETYEKVED